MNQPIEVADRALYLSDTETLVCADLHLGRDGRTRLELPTGEATRVPERISALVERFDPRRVVLAGDILDSFGHVPAGVPDTLEQIEAIVTEHGATLTVCRGNHDTMLEAVWDGPIRDEIELAGATIVCHGHEQPATDADRYVIGHGHPAIDIEGKRRPCFLVGPATPSSATVIALPAFTKLAPGTVINGGAPDLHPSPLVGDLHSFRPVVWDGDAEEALTFPPIRELEAFL